MSTWPHSKKLSFAFGEGRKSNWFLNYYLFCEAKLFFSLKKLNNNNKQTKNDIPYKVQNRMTLKGGEKLKVMV